MDFPKKNRIKRKLPDINGDSVRLFLFFFVIYAVFAHTIGDNENSRVDTTVSIVENGSISIDGLHQNTGDKAMVEGSYYSDKAPLSALTAVPGYLLVDSVFGGGMQIDYYLEDFRRSFSHKMEWARFVATVSVSSLVGASTVALIYLIGTELGLKRPDSLGIATVAGFSTLIFPYSTTLHGTMLGTFFLTAAFYLWMKEDYVPEGRKALYIPLLVGLGVSASYLVAVPGGILMSIQFLRNHSDMKLNLAQGSGFLLGLSPLLIFNFLATGNPVEPVFLHTLLVENMQSGEINARTSPVTMLAGILRGLVSPMNGLFIFCPVMLFGLLGLRHLKDDKILLGVILGGLVATLIGLSTLVTWGFNTFYGPRYLLPVSTLLFTATAAWIRNTSYIKKAVFYGISVVSGVFMLGSTQTWRGGFDTLVVQSEIQSELVSLGIYQNRLLGYLKTVPQEGLQSPILTFLMDPSSGLHTVLSSYPQHQEVLGVFHGTVILLDKRFLIALLVLLGIFMLFRSYLHKEKPELNWDKILVVLAMVLLLTGAGSKSFHMDNWYEKKPGERVVWGRDSPRIYFSSGGNQERVMEMEVSSNKPRESELFLNGRKIANLSTDKGGEELAKIVRTRKGINRLRFRTGRCTPVGRLANNSDERCFTVGLKQFNVQSLDSGKLFFDRLDNTSSGYRVQENRSRILVSGKGAYSVEMEVSSSSRTTVKLESSDKTVKGRVGSFPSVFNTPYMETEGVREFRIEKGCEACEVSIDSVKLRKYEHQPDTLLYRLGTGWYRPLDTEKVTWSMGRSEIYIYRYSNTTVKRELWVEGRAFGKPDNMTFKFNGREIEKRTVSDRFSKIAFNVTLEPGENVLSIDPENDCISIGEFIGNDDVRCASYGFKNLYLLDKCREINTPEDSYCQDNHGLSTSSTSSGRKIFDAFYRSYPQKDGYQNFLKEFFVLDPSDAPTHRNSSR